MRWVFLSSCLIFFYSVSFASSCEDKYNFNGPNIIILGDSFFTSEENKGDCKNLEQVISQHFNSQNVFNVAVDGGRYLIQNPKFSEFDILSKYFNYNWDVIVLGGGGNDFELCNLNQDCLVSTKKDILNKIRNFLSNAKYQDVYFIYTTQVSELAPVEWQLLIEAGGGEFLNEIYQTLASDNDRHHFIDLGAEMRSDQQFWSEDGYHPSLGAYKLIPKHLK